MKSKLNYLIGVSFKRKVKTKWFLTVNIILALIIIAGVNIDSIISYFGGDFNNEQEIYVIDNTGNSYDLFKQNIKNSEISSSYKVKKYNKNINKLKKKVKEDDVYAIIFNSDEDNVFSVKIIAQDYLDTLDSQIIMSSINSTKQALALSKAGIDPNILTQISKTPNIEYQYINESSKTGNEDAQAIISSIFPIIILPFFMLTVFLVQMIGAEVNDEKTTRGMEIIISNVSPTTHFFSKVIAGNLFVLMQGALLLIYSGFGLLIRKLIGGSSITGGVGSTISQIIKKVLESGIGDKLVYIIPLTLILMLLTFIAYSLLAGILASMSTNIEDFQQVQTPIMIISLVGYYLAMLSNVFGGSVFIKIVSFIPFISAILAPSLLMLGQIGVIEVIISIVLVIIAIYFLIKYGLKIYKAGILNYSSKGLWKKMYKALKD